VTAWERKIAMVHDWIKTIRKAGLNLTEMKCITAADLGPDDVIVLKIKESGTMDYIQYRQIRDIIRNVLGPERKVLIMEDSVDIFVLRNALQPKKEKSQPTASAGAE
jgi:hypothetical protein